MIRYPLLTAAVASVTLLTASPPTLAGLLAPQRLTFQRVLEKPVVPARHTVRQIVRPLRPSTYQPAVEPATSWEVLSAGDGIEKTQNVIEELILDDSLDSDFGGQLLSELDDVLDLRDANADDAETRDALAEVLDTLREGIENGEADSNAGRLVSGMIEGVINILLG